MPEVGVLIDVRILRLLRVFRVFKLTAYVSEYQVLGQALRASQRKIMVFLTAVMMIVLVVGTLMYVVEGPANGYTSIPTSVYWAITTMTTVGFGDITPVTTAARATAMVQMAIDIAFVAVLVRIISTVATNTIKQRASSSSSSE